MSALPSRQFMPLRGTLMPLVLGLLVALALALLLAVGWLGAPRQDVMELLFYLLFSGIISLAASVAAVGWLRRGQGKLWQQMSLAYSVGIGVAMFNVFLTARLMFISADHDLGLLVLLLLFAAVISLTLGYSLAHTLAQRVIMLCMGARAIRSGDLQTRVPATGSDELTELAREFNSMADQLALADEERRRHEAARRELIAAISHDLRTPLTSVRAMVEALADGIVDDPVTTQRYLQTMRSQIGHLNSLIDDLFELAQIDAGALRLDLQRIAPESLVREATEALAPQAQARQVMLACDVSPGIPPIACATQKIERVLYNLVSNAVRHTPAHGQVVIRVRPEIDVHPAMVVFEVDDTGEGITPEDQPFVFERFYRSEKSRSRSTGGAGLGLAIARGIVEAHQGQIVLVNRPGPGTCIQFRLPVT